MTTKIKIERVGQNFAFRGIVKRGNKVLHRTEIAGTAGVVRARAEAWAAANAA